MLTPMWVLAALCVLLGLLPVLMIDMLDRAISQWVPAAWGTPDSISLHVPLGWLMAISGLLLILILTSALWLRWRKAPAPTRAAGTWDCGYARPSPRMQYTGSSFSQMVVELLAWVLLSRQRSPKILGSLPRARQFFHRCPRCAPRPRPDSDLPRVAVAYGTGSDIPARTDSDLSAVYPGNPGHSAFVCVSL